ncbi:MAG: T9SS type A sorting domain-containing protein, partial [Bacteroidota bacterium]
DMEDLGDYLNGTKSMSVDVLSPAVGITVQITLEDTNTAEAGNFPVGRHSVYLATTTVANAWETLTFTFDNQPDASVANTAVERMVLLFNPNSNTDDTYLYDNVEGPELQNSPCDGVSADPFVFNDLECQQNVAIDFKHGFMTRIPNPDPSGANTTSHVLQYDRNSGELDDVIVGSFANNLDLTTNNLLNLKVWDSDAPSVIALSLQDASGNDIMVINDSTSASNTWQTLNYDFSSIANNGNVAQFVMLYKPGTNSFSTVYLDEFQADMSVGINDQRGQLDVLDLYTAPNPVTDQTVFHYTLAQSGPVTLTVYDLLGQPVAVPVNRAHPAGSYMIPWEPTAELAAGTYIYTLQTGNAIVSQRLVITR